MSSANIIKALQVDQLDESYENLIISHFFDYANDNQLISLPIPVVYRIVNHPILDFKELKEKEQNQFIDFLLK